MGTYADTVPTDGDGDKFHGVVTDNAGTNDIVAVKGVNRTTQNGEVVADLAVSLDGEFVNIATGATDDAAAAGQIFPVAGVYQATADTVDDGDVGRVRMTARRGLITVPDTEIMYGRDVAVSGDYEVSTTSAYSGYAAPTVAFFDGSDSGFTSSVRYIRVAWRHRNRASIVVRNSLDVDINVTLYLLLVGGGVTWSGIIPQITSSTTVTTSSNIAYGSQPLSGTDTGSFIHVGGLGLPAEYLVIGINPVADPTSGWLGFFASIA